MKIFVILCLLFVIFIGPVFAQTCSTSTTSPSRATGLISTPSLGTGTKFYTSPEGKCIVSEETIFVPFKIPTYDDLKSQYYTQSKATKSTISTLPLTIADQTIYFVNGDLNISSSPTAGGTAVVFVEGNLFINANITYGTAQTGLVFVVRGDVNIAQSVTGVNAVIISGGIICTAFDGAFCPAGNVTTSQLVINGSFISLDSAKPIRFRRTLTDNTAAAEVINHQVKYLVILRNLFSETVQKWSEVAGDILLPSPGPSVPPPPPSPTPTPTPTPTSTPTPTPAPTCTPQTWYRDADGDGYGTSTTTTSACTQPAGYVSNSSDCYDGNINAKPGQTAFFTVNRGDGSFDYDCSGGITYRTGSGSTPISRVTGVISCGGLNCTEPLTPSMCGVTQGYSLSDATCFTCSPQTRSGLWLSDVTLECK